MPLGIRFGNRSLYQVIDHARMKVRGELDSGTIFFDPADKASDFDKTLWPNYDWFTRDQPPAL